MKNCGGVRLFWLIFWICSFVTPAPLGDRYISLGPNITETVAYLGGEDKLVAVTNDCDYPETVKTKIKIGKYTYPDLEKLIALQPATVLMESTADPRFKAKLKDLHIEYRTYDLTSFRDYFVELQRLNKDLSLQAENKIQYLEQLWQAKLPQAHKQAVILIWQNPLMAAGKNTFLSDYFASLGYTNVIKAPRYPNITPEQIYKADLVIDLSGSAQRPELHYVKQVELNPDVFMRLSPRLLEARAATAETLSAITGSDWTETERQARIFDYRLLRIIFALLVGASLALSGLLYQGMLLNPLAEPYLLGVSSGAAVGALLGLLFGTLPFLTAIAGAILALSLVYLFARRQGRIDNNGLILSGVMINSFCGALIMLAVFFAGDKVNSLMFWLMGDLGTGTWLQAGSIAVALMIIAVFAFWQSAKIELLSVGDEQAESLGVEVGSLKSILLFLISALTALVVASVGIIGFVGLIIPHIVKMLFGERLGLNIFLTILCGAGFMVLSDIAARFIVPDIVLPVGIITALLGVPFFVLIYKRSV